ncbi:Lipoyltransferase and lipoate-protein ligase [Phlegmacium glaucopus]|nr:Lipoyltransferase and lipoate-protein ligase [Phlegmacium glaucopus]
MFRWHSTRLVSARIRTGDATLRSRLSLTSNFWRKLALRSITTGVSRSCKPSGPELPSLSLEHDIYISTSTDPFFNLTLEDWLFRHSPSSSPLLLIYRDSPCVIIGRNQNPWTEVNFTALRAARIPFIRRRSGGGTVYHDLGNTNFSLHLPRTSFDRHSTAKLVLRAVRSLGVDARVNERNDICVGINKISFHQQILVIAYHDPNHSFLLHHVSGSAYKIVNKRAYHHGTMLISTRLDHLSNLLRPEQKNMITKGVSSVRSPVCNLKQFGATITHEAYTSAVVEEFRKEYQINTECCVVDDSGAAKSIEYIHRGMSELSTWEWAFGQTPEFTYTLQHTFLWGDATAEIRSKHGVILDCSLQLKNTQISGRALETLTQWARSFYLGQRYGFLHEVEDGQGAGLLRCERNEIILDVKAWLDDAMKCNLS